MSIRSANSSSYRPYFQVLTDLLLSSGDHLPSTFETFVGSLLQKADSAATRHQASDADFLYWTFKFFHRIGTSSAVGQSIVAKYRDQWKKIRSKFSAMKRPGPPQLSLASTMAVPSHPTASSQVDSVTNLQKQDDGQALNKYSLDD